MTAGQLYIVLKCDKQYQSTIKKLSVFSDTDAGNKLKLWQKLTWKIFRLTKEKS